MPDKSFKVCQECLLIFFVFFFLHFHEFIKRPRRSRVVFPRREEVRWPPWSWPVVLNRPLRTATHPSADRWQNIFVLQKQSIICVTCILFAHVTNGWMSHCVFFSFVCTRYYWLSTPCQRRSDWLVLLSTMSPLAELALITMSASKFERLVYKKQTIQRRMHPVRTRSKPGPHPVGLLRTAAPD